MTVAASVSNISELTHSYPALAEMGIARFNEISHYSLRSDGADKDVLRVHYKRAKGSLLPQSRKYKFGRSLKTVIADGGTARMENTYEISPFLLKAVSELDTLVSSEVTDVPAGSSKNTQQERDSKLSADIAALESWVLENLDAQHQQTAAQRFAFLKAQLAEQ